MLVGNVLICYASGENLTHDSSLSTYFLILCLSLFNIFLL